MNWNNVGIVLMILVGIGWLAFFSGKAIRFGMGGDSVQSDIVEQPPEMVSLDFPHMREKLQALLAAYSITGSCDVRDGRVKPVLRNGTRAILATEIKMAVDQAMARTGNNSNLALYTHRNGIFVPVGQLTLEDVVTLCRLLEDEA